MLYMYTNVFGIIPDTTKSVWLGGRQVGESDDWLWDMSGQIVDPNLWYQSEPNDQGREDHICLKPAKNGLYDVNEGWQLIFLCETSGENLLC